MKSQIREKGSNLHCYKCGSKEIQMLCHHCGRPMCKRDGPVVPGLNLFTENREFDRLDMSSWPLRNVHAVHCEHCVHSSPNYRRIMILPGVLAVLIGLYLAIEVVPLLTNCFGRLPAGSTQGITALVEFIRDPDAYMGLQSGMCYRPELLNAIWGGLQAIIILVFGGIVTGTGIYLNDYRIADDLKGWRPKVPLGPVTDKIRVREYIQAKILLDADGQARVDITDNIFGSIDPGFRFIPTDLDRLGAYCHKYTLSGDDHIEFDAGDLVLGGGPKLKLKESFKIESLSLNLIPLVGNIQDYPYLQTGRGVADYFSEQSITYDVCLVREVKRWGLLPVRVLPLFSVRGDQRRFALQVQFNPKYFRHLKTPAQVKGKELEKYDPEMNITLETVQLFFDKEKFGRPRADGMILDRLDSQVYEVEWRGFWKRVEDGVMQFSLPSVEFTQRINPEDKVSGKLRLRVPALYSGLSRIDYYSAIGELVAHPESTDDSYPFQSATMIDLEFELALGQLPQAVLVTLPGISPEAWLSTAPTDLHRHQVVRKYQGIPDRQRIQSLLEAINRDPASAEPSEIINFHRIQQDQPRPSEHEASQNRWHWDIAGRWLDPDQMLPIDFHIVVYGEGRDNGGMTYVELSVRALIDDESAAGLQASYDELWAVITQALEGSQATYPEKLGV